MTRLSAGAIIGQQMARERERREAAERIRDLGAAWADALYTRAAADEASRVEFRRVRGACPRHNSADKWDRELDAALRADAAYMAAEVACRGTDAAVAVARVAYYAAREAEEQKP